MKKFFIAILLLFTTILPTFATNWVQVGEKSWLDVDTIEPFMDDYGKIVPNQYSFWIKHLNNGNMMYGSDGKSYIKSGNMIYGSDGTTLIKSGNFIYSNK